MWKIRSIAGTGRTINAKATGWHNKQMEIDMRACLRIARDMVMVNYT